MAVERVLVVGAGTMGNGIAQAAAQAGYRASLFDVAPGAVEKGSSENARCERAPGTQATAGKGPAQSLKTWN